MIFTSNSKLEPIASLTDFKLETFIDADSCAKYDWDSEEFRKTYFLYAVSMSELHDRMPFKVCAYLTSGYPQRTSMFPSIQIPMPRLSELPEGSILVGESGISIMYQKDDSGYWYDYDNDSYLSGKDSPCIKSNEKLSLYLGPNCPPVEIDLEE